MPSPHAGGQARSRHVGQHAHTGRPGGGRHASTACPSLAHLLSIPCHQKPTLAAPAPHPQIQTNNIGPKHVWRTYRNISTNKLFFCNPETTWRRLQTWRELWLAGTTMPEIIGMVLSPPDTWECLLRAWSGFYATCQHRVGGGLELAWGGRCFGIGGGSLPKRRG